MKIWIMYIMASLCQPGEVCEPNSWVEYKRYYKERSCNRAVDRMVARGVKRLSQVKCIKYGDWELI